MSKYFVCPDCKGTNLTPTSVLAPCHEDDPEKWLYALECLACGTVFTIWSELDTIGNPLMIWGRTPYKKECHTCKSTYTAYTGVLNYIGGIEIKEVYCLNCMSKFWVND